MAIAIHIPDDIRDKLEEKALRVGFPNVESLVEDAVRQLAEEDDEVDTAAWKDEIERRLEEVKNGTVKTIPADEVIDEMRSMLTTPRHARSWIASRGA